MAKHDARRQQNTERVRTANMREGKPSALSAPPAAQSAAPTAPVAPHLLRARTSWHARSKAVVASHLRVLLAFAAIVVDFVLHLWAGAHTRALGGRLWVSRACKCDSAGAGSGWLGIAWRVPFELGPRRSSAPTPATSASRATPPRCAQSAATHFWAAVSRPASGSWARRVGCLAWVMCPKPATGGAPPARGNATVRPP